MNKAIIIIVILAAALVYVESSRCRPRCSKQGNSHIKCVKQGSICRKMKQCSIDEQNCHRRQAKRPLLKATSSALCRNIKGSIGTGRCAIKKRGPRSVIPRRCQLLNCPERSKKLNCYSDKRNNCQLLTTCQVLRANCLRGRNNLLEWVDLRRCAGMRAGQALKKCRPGPRRS